MTFNEVADIRNCSTEASVFKILKPIGVQLAPFTPVAGLNAALLAISKFDTVPGKNFKATFPEALVMIPYSEESEAMSTFLGF
jgi:hypothetical protein